MKKEIVVVVILYNSLPKNYGHIFQVYNDIKLIFVDNTPNRVLECSDEHIDYLPLGDNMGIAYALNKGCRIAMEKYEAEWVLTLDQDSDIPINMIKDYLDFIKSNKINVGMVSPLINVYYGDNKQVTNDVICVNDAITSGSLLNMNAYSIVGGFKDELFIDEVDFEYCYNLRCHGYQIYQLNYVLMQHQLAKTKEYKLFGRHMFYVLNHDKIRHYYMQRNSLYVRNKYRKEFPNLKMSFIQKILPFLKILFFEDDKFEKILYRYRGYCDYKHNVLGKYKEK